MYFYNYGCLRRIRIGDDSGNVLMDALRQAGALHKNPKTTMKLKGGRL